MQELNPVEFFRNLPPKLCPECGGPVSEQAESYAAECDPCQTKQDLS